MKTKIEQLTEKLIAEGRLRDLVAAKVEQGSGDSADWAALRISLHRCHEVAQELRLLLGMAPEKKWSI